MFYKSNSNDNNELQKISNDYFKRFKYAKKKLVRELSRDDIHKIMNTYRHNDCICGDKK